MANSKQRMKSQSQKGQRRRSRNKGTGSDEEEGEPPGRKQSSLRPNKNKLQMKMTMFQTPGHAKTTVTENELNDNESVEVPINEGTVHDKRKMNHYTTSYIKPGIPPRLGTRVAKASPGTAAQNDCDSSTIVSVNKDCRDPRSAMASVKKEYQDPCSKYYSSKSGILARAQFDETNKRAASKSKKDSQALRMAMFSILFMTIITWIGILCGTQMQTQQSVTPSASKMAQGFYSPQNQIIITPDTIETKINSAMSATASVEEKHQDPGMSNGVPQEDSAHEAARHCNEETSTDQFDEAELESAISAKKVADAYMIQVKREGSKPVAKRAPTCKIPSANLQNSECREYDTASSAKEECQNPGIYNSIPKEDSAHKAASKATSTRRTINETKLKSTILAKQAAAVIVHRTSKEAKSEETEAEPPDPVSRDKNSTYNIYWKNKLSIKSSTQKDLKTFIIGDSKVMGENILGRASQVSLRVSSQF